MRSDGGHRLRLRSRRSADDLQYAIVIEPSWYSAWSNEHRDAVPYYHCLWVIDFNPLATIQLNCENSKRPLVNQCVENNFKIFRSHTRTKS